MSCAFEISQTKVQFETSPNLTSLVEVVAPSGLSKIAFSDHLIAILNGNTLNFATSIGFSYLEPFDGGC